MSLEPMSNESNRESPLTFGSLFAGIGGFDLGFYNAGMISLWHSEIDQNCQQVLSRHFPNAEQLGDVQNVTKETARAVDLICGGFPCQDLSIAGKRAGLDGKRSGLWFEFHRVLEELRPRWVVIENVPGLLSSNGGRDFAVILSGLAQLGYYAAWRVLDAQYFGVAQRRRRVFIVGHLGDGRAAEVLFESEGGAWDSAPSRETGAGTTGAVAGCLNSGGNNGGFRTEPGEHIVARQAEAGYWNADGLAGLRAHPGGIDENLVAFQSKASASNSMNPGPVCPSIDVGKAGGLAVMIAPTIGADIARQAGGKPGIEEYTRAVHSSGGGVRRLTPTECECLQGFPDRWTEGHSDSARYRMLGNAVAVSCAEWIGNRIMLFREALLNHILEMGEKEE